ncbi:MAG: hypothetical protein SFU98_01865 [Leptospiraceae bacterium]|nr:hypothetical protein [Leptospiraceae bacterium]
MKFQIFLQLLSFALILLGVNCQKDSNQSTNPKVLGLFALGNTKGQSSSSQAAQAGNPVVATPVVASNGAQIQSESVAKLKICTQIIDY